MLPLDDPKWGQYIGGYQLPWNASHSLRQLLEGPEPQGALEELENELCHQGDLGSASYASVPWLVEYLRQQPELDARAVGLVLTIEFGRPFNRGPVPEELQAGYDLALRDLPEVVLSKRHAPWNDIQTQVGAAALALAQGNRWFARTYFELDRAVLDDLIEQEFGSKEWDWP